MKNKKNIKLIIVLILIIILGVVGTTIAFYSSSNTFNNVFGTKIYKMEVVETFESPDDWTPGTTTPKTLIVTNKGDVDAAVRVSYVEEWKDASDNTLPLVDSNNERAAIINFSDYLRSKWLESTENGKKYYYYKYKLGSNQSTQTLIDSVTFNPNVQISSSNNCVTDSNDNTQTCTIETAGYAGGTYKLIITVETIQYDQYKNGWNTDVEIANSISPAYSVVSGDINTVGSVVRIANEDFIVIGQEDSNHVKLFAKYNLKVGKIYNPSTKIYTGEYTSLDSGYGLQYANAKGCVLGDSLYYGVVTFSDTNYWYNEGLKPQYGNTYPTLVYDNNSQIKSYVDSYVRYLRSNGAVVTGRIITEAELLGFGCDNTITMGCDKSGVPDWVHTSTYWTSTAVNDSGLRVVGQDGWFSYRNYDFGHDMGVRPVIILEK